MNLTLEDLTASSAHRTGHFCLSSGLHSGDYLQCALHLQEPQRAEKAGRMLAQAIRANSIEIDSVVSPAMGGLIIGHETARALDVTSLFTERKGGEMMLRRGFSLRDGERVLIVEDVVTTGKSTREVITILQSYGAKVVAVGSLVNRSGVANPFEPIPYEALVVADFSTWKPEECPLCAKGMEIDKPGSRPGK
ncbi:MAG: orotate phosphoribosyltransferase [bacterium]|nr:orotate phosphoribosyltransferase [bacterium]